MEDDDPKEKVTEEEVSENNEMEEAKSKKAFRKGYGLRKGTPDPKGKSQEEIKQPKLKGMRKGKPSSEDITELQSKFEKKLTLKVIVKNAITKNGGTASFDTIYKYVSKVEFEY